jgi:hypothetical protein
MWCPSMSYLALCNLLHIYHNEKCFKYNLWREIKLHFLWPVNFLPVLRQFNRVGKNILCVLVPERTGKLWRLISERRSCKCSSVYVMTCTHVLHLSLICRLCHRLLAANCNRVPLSFVWETALLACTLQLNGELDAVGNQFVSLCSYCLVPTTLQTLG